MLGASVLNGFELNGFTTPILLGSGTIISIRQQVVEPNAGTLISIEQSIGQSGGGTLISIEQLVIFEVIGVGTLISIEQEVATMQSGTLISIEQRIKNSAIATPDRIARTGWDVVLIVGGASLPCQTGMIVIQRNEGGASLMEITFLPEPGVQDVEGFAGKAVTLDIETNAGVFRAFTGIVDIGEVDLIGKSIKLNCTDRRTELINAQLGGIVNSIGYSSPIIFQTPKDVFENLSNRLTTVPFTVDFDAYGNFNLVNINPKAVADFTLTGNSPDGVFYRDPKVEYTSRARITNQVTISFQYRHPRLWQMERSWSWHTTASICDQLIRSYTFANRDLITKSVMGTSWPIHGNIAFVPVTPTGVYCGGVIWSTVHLNATTTNVLDSSNNQVFDTVTDTAGNTKQIPRTVTNITGGTDVGSLLADGASWRAAKRWVQTINENYTLIVRAPQSITQYGIIDTAAQYSGEDPVDTANWEDFEVFDNPFNKADNLEAQNYFVDSASNRGAINSGIVTALAIAKTTIQKSHRDTRVSVIRSLWPEIDLKHTVAVNATITNGGALSAKGKVYTIEHSLNIGTGEAFTRLVLALSRSTGTSTDTSLAVPAIPVDTSMPNHDPIVLGSHFGEDPNTEAARTWTGYVGNKIVGFFRSTYPIQFIVDTPAIPDAFRNERNMFAGAFYNVVIPNDTLTVTF